MTLDIMRAEQPKLDELDAKAREAVKVFRALQPTLDAYFHALTGRKEGRVLPAVSDNGSTDGKNIYFRPPIELGDRSPHQRALCDKRDPETDKMLCPACKVREKVLVTIYHEIDHNVYESFESVSEPAKVRAIEWAIREARGKHADQIKARIDNAPSWKKDDYLNLASLINEFLPTIVGVLEDARVDTAMFREKPGTKRMFDADNREIFEKGFEGRDPNTGALRTFQWRDAPLNNQVIIGLYCKIAGLEYETWFAQRVVDALNDTDLTKLTDSMENVRSAGAVYNLSFKVLQRLRELGYCGTPQDPDPEPEPESEPEKEPEHSDDNDTDDSSSDEAGDPSNDGEESPGESDESSGDESEDNSSEGDEGKDQSPSGQSEGEPSETGSDNGDDGQPSGENEEVDENAQAGNTDDSPEVDDLSPGTPDDGAESSPQGEPESGDQSEDSDHPSEDGQDSGQGRPDSSGPGSEPLDEQSNEEGSTPESSGTEECSQATGETSGQTLPADTGLQLGGHETDNDEGSNQEPGDDPGDGSDPSEGTERDDEPLDTGADDGYGGTRVEKEPEYEPEMGTPEEAAKLIKLFGDHDEKPHSLEEAEESNAIEKAIIQGIYFTTPSVNIHGVVEHFYGKPILDRDGRNTSHGWRSLDESQARRLGKEGDFEIPETVLSPSVIKIRRVFTDNQRGSSMNNLRSGRVDARALGRRAWSGDPHLFRRDRLPGRKNWFVEIGLDLSGSTVGENIKLEKRAVMGQCEMLTRAGIPFELFAHTGQAHYGSDSLRRSGHDLSMYHVKDAEEPWNDVTRERLIELVSCGVNLDGHALEFLRKRADRAKATNKVVLYYSDGKMPASNHDEELDILQREIGICRNKGYVLLGVGIRTDSPKAHGLDTVEVHADDDLAKVVEHLGRRISGETYR